RSRCWPDCQPSGAAWRVGHAADRALGPAAIGVLRRLRDGDALARRLGFRYRGADLEDSLVVTGRDLVTVRVGGQRDRPGERAVPELRAVRLLVIFVPFDADRQDTGGHRDLDVLIGIHAREFGAD